MNQAVKKIQDEKRLKDIESMARDMWVAMYSRSSDGGYSSYQDVIADAEGFYDAIDKWRASKLDG